ncbi:MAG TPA: hypothetical protein PKI93_04715 [Alphaproteobacteria bacterium]|nr:hypothetical protein [Alphaproteobacteria bacterium]HNS44002.1 hypothetical protein [Alphaproteobacteria bacterium]
MTDFLDAFGWWIAVIELPVLSALFWMIQHLRDDLANHRLEVAKNYAQVQDLRLLENRITSHLLRIEAKLDVTALKAEKNSQ